MQDIIVYGFGNRGRSVVDQLLFKGVEVSMILDKNPTQTEYRNIQVRSLHDAPTRSSIRGKYCIIGLHNSYVDIKEINQSLIDAECIPISLVNVDKFGIEINIENGYWLNKNSPGFHISNDDADWMKGNLEDEKSFQIFSNLKKYRETGDIEFCPFPSTEDEYTPNDLAPYPDPINLIDCGAYTGVAYRKFSQKYVIKKYLAFEPDLQNFSRLLLEQIKSEEVTLLPLGVWNNTTQLRFSVGQEMGSAIDTNGDTLIQVVSVDDVTPNFDATVVKFDVEGAELNGLKGMKKLISAKRPFLCVSLYHRPEDLVLIPRELASWGLNYKFYLRVHEHNGFGTVLYARPSS